MTRRSLETAHPAAAAASTADVAARRLPFIVEAPQPNGDLARWAADHGPLVGQLLLAHRALLLRGFDVRTADDLQAFVDATSTGPPLQYVDRSTPRYEVGPRIYVSTIYPREQAIHLHNEGTYWTTWPLKIYFCCLVPAASGGATPIADVRRVLERIDPAVRDRCREKGVMYVRNYNRGLGLTWQDAFQTSDPAAVERYAADHDIAVEWTADGHLRTRQVRPAIRAHPITGEPVWFNHAAFFHVTSLAPHVRDALLSSFEERDLPYNTYFGDGTPIDPAIVAHVRDAYAAEQVAFAWQRGDVLLLDNMSVAHAREPYTGEREVIVAMTEPQSDGAAAASAH
jgi:alpha-ketoglutarate-dependent taurine dioxygenase